MAARKLRPQHQDDIRAKIQADKIVHYLQEHLAGKHEMSQTQIQAAKILLDKSISNAATIIGADETIKKIVARWLN